MSKPQLSSALEGKYKMAAGLNPGRYTISGQTIDTTTCTLDEAEAFVKQGFQELVKIEPAAPKKAGKQTE